MKYILLVVAILGMLGTGIWNVSRWYTFNHDIGGYLKLAADAPNVEKANEYLTHALTNMAKQDLVSGSTAYFLHNPNCDLGIWNSQIAGANQTLIDLMDQMKVDPNSVPQLVKDNALMKIREVLLDDGIVTQPPHIVEAPYQWVFLLLYFGFTLIGILCFAWIASNSW